MSTNWDIRKSITDFAAEAGAWLAPLPSAAFASAAASKHMGLGPEMSLISGAVVELLGLATANRAFALWEYNATRTADQPKAPTWIAAGMFGLYLVSTIGLSVLADVDPALVKWLPAILPVMAMAGTVTVALGKQHDLRLKRNAAVIAKREVDAREAEQERKRIEAERKAEHERLRLEAKADAERKETERKAEREARRLERQQKRQETSTDGSIDATIDKLQAGRAAKKTSIIDAMLNVYRDNPHVGDTELGGMVGVTRQTIYNYRTELEAAGRIHKNGNGVEILS